MAQTETGGQAQHPMLIDIDNRIAHLKRRLEFRPECERPENERLLAKARAERDRWLADNPTNVDTADPTTAPDADDPTTGDRDHA